MEIQQLLNDHIDGTLLLGMSRRLQLAPRLEKQGLQIGQSGTRQSSMSDVHRALTPSYNRLNLIDIQKVIGVMATSIQNKEWVL